MSLHCKLDFRGKMHCHSQKDCDESCEQERKIEEEKLKNKRAK